MKSDEGVTIYRWAGLTAESPIVCSVRRQRPWDSGWHMHYALELGVVLRGALRHTSASGAREAGRGDVWLTGMLEAHRAEILSRSCTSIMIQFLPEALPDWPFVTSPGVRLLSPFSVPAADRPRTTDGNRKEVLAVAARIRRLVTDHSEEFRYPWGQVSDVFTGWHSHNGLRLVALFMELLAVLHRDWRAVPETDMRDAGVFRRVRPAIRMVFESRRFIPACRAARACEMSRVTLDGLFRKITGMSFAKFALQYRLRNAVSELVADDDEVKTIALRWGFTDVSHFDRLFRQHYGCRPSEHREKLRGTA